MPVTYLILLAIGLGLIWVGLRAKEEVLRITAVVSGAIFLIWGFALAPLQFQLLIAALVVVAVFATCMRCLEC